MACIHHVFTFDDEYQAGRFVWRLVRDIGDGALQFVPILKQSCVVHVLDADNQTHRLLALSKESSSSGMRAIRVPYPSEPPT